MAMLITKFHRLIQSRLLWGVFLMVIVFSFVIWGMQSPGRGREARETAAGILDGDPVTWEEFRQAYMHTYLSLAMMFGGHLESDMLREEINEEAWKRLAALREAGAMGFTADNEEVADAIRTYPYFLDQGRFDRNRYAAFVGSFLRNLGFTEQHFELYVREELILQKARQAIEQAALLSPLEINRALTGMGDLFDLEGVRIVLDALPDPDPPGEAELRALFRDQPDAFRLPPMVEVAYVRFPVADYLREEEVTEEEALAYHEEHADLFRRAVETPQAEEAGEEREEEDRPRMEPIPFEEAREGIVRMIASERARGKAMDMATEFSIDLAPDRQGRAPSFEQLAERYGREVFEPEPFTAREQVPGVDAGPAFNEAAFAARPTPDDYFSYPIRGDEHVYVLGLRKRLREREASFEEVEDRVRAAAERRARTAAIQEYLEAVRATIAQGLDDGRTFAESAAPLGLETFAATNLTAMTISEGDEESRDMLRAALTHNAGELTDPVPVEDGFLLLHVARREPSRPEEFAYLRPHLVASLRQERARLLFEDWRDSLLADGRFENLTVSAEVYEEEEEDDQDGDMPPGPSAHDGRNPRE